MFDKKYARLLNFEKVEILVFDKITKAGKYARLLNFEKSGILVFDKIAKADKTLEMLNFEKGKIARLVNIRYY